MTAGRFIGVAIVVIAAVAGGMLYYLQGVRYYEPVEGLRSVMIGGQDFAVRDYVGLDNPELPVRLRGCFTLEDPEGAAAAAPVAERAVPYAAPGWFDCWDAEAMDRDIKAGRATAVLAAALGVERSKEERIVVVYPDGRAYQWRRLVE